MINKITSLYSIAGESLAMLFSFLYFFINCSYDFLKV